MFIVPIDKKFSVEQLTNSIRDVCERQDHALSLEFGLILVHTEAGTYQYYKSYSN